MIRYPILRIIVPILNETWKFMKKEITQGQLDKSYTYKMYFQGRKTSKILPIVIPFSLLLVR